MTPTRSLRFVILQVIVWLIVNLGRAEAQGGLAVASFGTTQESLYRVGLMEFQPLDSTTAFSDGLILGGGPGRYITAGPNELYALPHLPSGALVTGVTFNVCVSDPVLVMEGVVYQTDRFGQGLLEIGWATSSGMGCQDLYVDLMPANFVVNNNGDPSLMIMIYMQYGYIHYITGATVHYRLQVSPAPATPSFGDVPVTDPAFQFIEAFNAAGITAGCSITPPLFCPDGAVTRRQMAVFFAKALGLQWN